MKSIIGVTGNVWKNIKMVDIDVEILWSNRLASQEMLQSRKGQKKVDVKMWDDKRRNINEGGEGY